VLAIAGLALAFQPLALRRQAREVLLDGAAPIAQVGHAFIDSNSPRPQALTSIADALAEGVAFRDAAAVRFET